MTYDGKIPEFALQPAKEAPKQQKVIDDGFDPTPYDRLLAREPEEQEEKIEVRQVIETEQKSVNAPEPELVPKEEYELKKENESREDEKEQDEEIIEFEELAESGAEMMAAAEPVKIKPMANAASYQELKLQTIVQQAETRVFIEEDILVPDVKPDLISILSIEGNPVLSGKEFQISQQDESLRITGEIALQTIYLPEIQQKDEPIVFIASRLPFKTDWQVNASPISHLSVRPVIEKIEYTVVNERKFRAKITLKLLMKEYAEKIMNLFEQLKGEELQLKKEKIQLSNIPLRKRESLELSETFRPKDSNGKPVKLLKYNLNIVENHKQITSEKMVINGTVLCNVLYMAEHEKDGEIYNTPEFMQNKIDFTQFILLDKIEKTSGSKVAFDGKDLTLKIDEMDSEAGFILSGSIDTAAEIYEPIEKEVVSDFYHKTSDTTYEKEEKTFPVVAASGSTETSAREIAAVPEKNGIVGKVLYLSGRIKESRSTMENGRGRVEGILQCELLCLGEEKDGRPFTVTQDIPFRGTVELPEGREGMNAESQIFIRDLWFDKINDRQIEVNAGLMINIDAVEEKKLTLVKNPCFIEGKKNSRPAPMVIYVTGKDDTLWNVAKRYKAPIESITKINGIAEHEPIKEGMRLLIVK